MNRFPADGLKFDSGTTTLQKSAAGESRHQRGINGSGNAADGGTVPMFQFNCPHCGSVIRIDEKHRGKKGRCRSCGEELLIPAAEEQTDEFLSVCLSDTYNTELGIEERQGKAAANSRQLERSSQMKVTTGDLHEPYEIIGPVYFSVSNKGLFFNRLEELISKYRQKLTDMKSSGVLNDVSTDWGFLYGQFSVGQSYFDSAFFVAVQELKLRAGRVGGDAIVYMRQDIDIDTEGMQYFYLQMYGTAVRIKHQREM